MKKTIAERFLKKAQLQRDDLGTFWLVLWPSAASEMIDICFHSTLADVIMQAKGGLAFTDIAGVFKRERPAKAFAESLLAKQEAAAQDIPAPFIAEHEERY